MFNSEEEDKLNKAVEELLKIKSLVRTMDKKFLSQFKDVAGNLGSEVKRIEEAIQGLSLRIEMIKLRTEKR